jgi:nitrous oxide reductase accessory protein NosL
MKRSLYCSLAVFILVATCFLPAVAETVNCTEFGMSVDMNSRFTAKIVQGDATSYFCDIGDLFSYLKRNKPEHVNVAVKDHLSGEWIDANTAYFVHNEQKFKTPMGWGIAAFRDKNRASEAGETMGLAAALKALK